MAETSSTRSSPTAPAQRAQIIADLLSIAPHTEIVHHIPGRIRLRLKPSGLDVIRRIDLESLMRHIPGIRNQKINPVVGSLTLEYDPVRLPFTLWEQLGALRSRPEMRSQVETLLQNLWE